ncbi:right-handed parallel beta-helix repeat-containing protein [Neobacillus sp. YIM B06451]|uniref:right-handed parallel beta-helix repeat-containing protein n=1 Tax=Neobacillus sp. YIM B06451 TaxID=3070994 RepID=UPI00292F1C0D|nr:right-handed parallel beta-helix repeat-containing protein [Neobacillus sp. YIM B06451]
MDFANEEQSKMTPPNNKDLSAYMSSITLQAGDPTGRVQSTAELQALFDKSATGDTIVIPPGLYWVEKNKALTDFPNNDQPCLLLRGKKNIRISAWGATFETRTHAQGILELQLCEDIVIEGLKTKGYGKFPPLDPVTGYGEKGTTAGGYPTSGYWNYYKNNSFDTSAKLKNDGIPFGTFGGGFIGNIGSGILIHRGCRRITLEKCESYGFNYAGFLIGHLGDYFPANLGYSDNSDIKFINCYGHDNYSANFAMSAVDRPEVIDCLIERAGHPNASKTHTYVDPGYGINMVGTNYSKARDGLFHANTIRGNKRKGIDAHSGGGMIATDNFIADSMVCGIFYQYVNSTQYARDSIIANNKMVNCGYARNPLAAIALEGARGGTKATQELNALVKNNHIKKCFGTYGIIFVGAFDRVSIEGNIIHGVPDQLDKTITAFNPCAIYCGYSVATQPNYSGNVSHNEVEIEDSAIPIGIMVRNLQEGTVSGNTVKLPHSAAKNGIKLWNCDKVGAFGNTVRLGTIGEPLTAETNGTVLANTLTGGNAAYQPIQGQPVAFRIAANSGNGVVTYKAGTQFVDSIVSNTYGLAVNLKNVPSGTSPFVKVMDAGSGGLVAGSTVMGYYYIRSASHTQVMVGIKANQTASHTPFNTLKTGALDIEITI